MVHPLQPPRPLSSSPACHLPAAASTCAARTLTLKKLRSALDSLFAKKLDPAALDELVKELVKKKVVTETSGKLTYGVKR